MIRIRDVQKRYGPVEALAPFSLDLERGARLGVRGPNGSGKSTLLGILAGLLEPTDGTIEGLPPPGRAVLVHQRPHLFRGTARSNVVFALRIHDRPRAEADGWLERMGAGHLAGRRARDLSIGERQRVALARALACSPELLLLDEPFAALDAAGLESCRAVLGAYEGTLVLAAPYVEEQLVERVVALGANARASR